MVGLGPRAAGRDLRSESPDLLCPNVLCPRTIPPLSLCTYFAYRCICRPEVALVTGIAPFSFAAGLTTLVHNNSQAQIMERWKCRHMVLGFIPGQYMSGKVFERTSQFSVAVVCSFSDDEPLDVVFEAAKICSDVCFYITGRPRSTSRYSIARRPENCILTGYLPYDQYVSLLQNADAVMCLSTRDNTLLMGAMEAVSLTTPLIVSDWPVLRDTFPIGTVHVSNTPQGISQGICRVQSERASLQHQMVTLKEQLDREFKQRFGELEQLLQSH